MVKPADQPDVADVKAVTPCQAVADYPWRQKRRAGRGLIVEALPLWGPILEVFPLWGPLSRLAFGGPNRPGQLRRTCPRGRLAFGGPNRRFPLRRPCLRGRLLFGDRNRRFQLRRACARARWRRLEPRRLDALADLGGEVGASRRGGEYGSESSECEDKSEMLHGAFLSVDWSWQPGRVWQSTVEPDLNRPFSRGSCFSSGRERDIARVFRWDRRRANPIRREARWVWRPTG
jgi:hypothetical protein